MHNVAGNFFRVESFGPLPGISRHGSGGGVLAFVGGRVGNRLDVSSWSGELFPYLFPPGNFSRTIIKGYITILYIYT